MSEMQLSRDQMKHPTNAEKNWDLNLNLEVYNTVHYQLVYQSALMGINVDLGDV